MLVLSRKLSEAIIVNGPARIVIVGVRGDTVRLGFEAERDVNVVREELLKDGQQGLPNDRLRRQA